MNILIKLTSIVALIIAPHISEKKDPAEAKQINQPKVEMVTADVDNL